MLPIAPVEYGQQYQGQFSNALRLYFNQLSNTFGTELGPTGGRFLNFPYAAIQRTTDKTFTANTATEVTLDQNDFLNACANDGTNGITVTYAGLYNYQFSVQWKNTDSQEHDAWIWLRVNSTDVAGTASQFTVPSKHGSVDGHLIAAANFYVQLDAGDAVKLYAAVSNATVSMEAYAAQTSPFVMPSIPSVVATLTFVSSVPA
jgi:hypothetical protein